MSKAKFKVGDKVVVSYNTTRYGTVLSVEKRRKCNALYRVECVKDRCRKNYKRPFLVSVDEAWMDYDPWVQ